MNRDAKQPIAVLVADDHAIVRSGLKLLLDASPSFRVVAEAATAEEASALTARERPDVVLVDLDLGGESGLEVIRRGRELSPSTRFLVLTGVRDADLHLEAMKLGAAGVVRKDDPPEVLLKAIDKVHAGEIWLDRRSTARVLRELTDDARDPPRAPPTPDGGLTPREREIAALVAEGLRNKEIGKRLFISEITVRHHLTSIFAKLGVSDRLSLVILAQRHGLVRKPK